MQDILSNLVLEKLETIENSKIDTNTNKKKKDAWNSVHQLFIASTENNRTLEQLQSQWRKIKSVAKSKNSLFLKQMKQTGGGPPPEPLNSVEEQLILRIPKQFEHDSNMYDSNSTSQDHSEQLESAKQQKCNMQQKNDDISNCLLQLLESDDEADVSFMEKKITSPKRKKHGKDEESAKRIKLLDVSILQKETEIKLSQIQSDAQKAIDDAKKKVLDLQYQQMIEEHQIKMDKLKLELECLKKKGFFN